MTQHEINHQVLTELLGFREESLRNLRDELLKELGILQVVLEEEAQFTEAVESRLIRIRELLKQTH